MSAAIQTSSQTSNWRPSQAEAAGLLLKRRAARTDLIDFTRYTFPRYLVGRHHRVIADKLHQVEAGHIRRLMIFTPPRHGKSELVSRRFPAFCMGRRPTREIISASYGQDLASDFGRDVRNIIAANDFRALFPTVSVAVDSGAKNRWHSNHGGSYVAAGVGTAITGRGADILSIDDPLKDRAEADSEATRNAVWAWYTSTAYTRLMPGGAIILTMTRWHEDDLAGRLLAEMQNGGDQWDILEIPALSRGMDADPLHREEGEPIWPEKYGRDRLDEIRRAIGERDWAALYDQRPRPLEGSLFKTHLIPTLPAEPAGIRWVRAWDLAATRQMGTRDPDWTVGLKLGKTSQGHYVVGDIVRLRGDPSAVEDAIMATASRDGRSVRISLPQDPGQAGKAQAEYFVRGLAGFEVEATPESGDKATRAGPVAAQCNIGNLKIVEAPWNRAFCDELAGFPAAAHDDQVDALSRAFSVVSTAIKPLAISDSLLAMI